MKVSNYRATHNEANFGRPIATQVDGGAHITFEFITKKGELFFMTRWPKGLPRHDDPPDALRFPHGLIRVGESLADCASRIISDQLGMKVVDVRIVEWDSYMDDSNHWHVEPCCIVEVKGYPHLPAEASEIVSFDLDHLPKMTFWPEGEFRAFIAKHVS